MRALGEQREQDQGEEESHPPRGSDALARP
jgi:hypothetical protein